MEGSSSSPQQMVFQALQMACSQNAELLKQAETKLAEWETEPGFYLTLLGVFSNHTVDGNVRWMAAVYFKNGVNKYWRKNAKNEIQQAEKAQIRTQLVTALNEPVPQIAVQIAALIAKIARLDCPKDWPELIPFLLEAIRTTDEVHQHRALLVLQHVVKALSSKRMLPDKKLFEQLTENIYDFILNLWDGFTTLFFQSLQESRPTELSIVYLEKALLSLRIMRKLTIYGFFKPRKSEHCMLFLEAIFRRIKESVQCRYELKLRNAPDNLIELLEKFILKQSKILNEFREQHPLSFIGLISTALEFSFNYVFSSGTNMIYENNVISFTNFAIHCINLMKGTLSNLSSSIYNTYVQVNGDEDIPVAFAAKRDFFTQERLSYICEKVITHYFLLTQADMDLWLDEPESFASDEGGESWKYALRPCAETFFLTLFSEFRAEMTAEVLKYIRKAQEMILTPESSLKDILLKDAIYNAAGLAAFNLYDEVDFDAWFSNQLLSELQVKTDNFRIIRRRAIWLIGLLISLVRHIFTFQFLGQWTGVKFSRNLRPQVYSVCLDLLQPHEDMSVRLAASKTLMTTMDDFDFEATPFLQYLEPSFSLLFTLLKQAKECDTKMNVLCIMSFIVDKMSDNIQPQADNLITYLPLLWKESEDHNMLRCAIISTLLQIVKALCDIPPNLTPFLYPVIEISTDVKDPSHVYLMEEGLELWLAVIENSTALTPQLLELCKNLVPIIEISSENLRTVLYIIQAYIILSPDIYLQSFGEEVVSTCAYLMSDMRPEGIVMLMKLFESSLRAETTLSMELLKPVLPVIFKQVYENKDYPMVMTMYLAIVARVLILNQVIFLQALQEMNTANPLEQILDVWISKMPLVTQVEKRKLLSLALGSILTVDSSMVYERFSGILQNICESLNDIMKDEGDGNLDDTLVFEDEIQFDSNTVLNMEDFEYKTHHYERCRRLCLKDPVHRIVLKDYIQSQISLLKDNLGEQRFQSLMMTVDSSILANLAEYMNIFVEVPKTVE